MSLTTRISEADQRYGVAEQISNDTLGNKRIAILKELTHNAVRKVVSVQWNIHTVDVNGEDIKAPNILNPYVAYQTAGDGVRVDPLTGVRNPHTPNDYSETSRADLESECTSNSIDFVAEDTDDELKAKLLSYHLEAHTNSTISQYDFFTGSVKSEQARYYQALRAYLKSEDAKGGI